MTTPRITKLGLLAAGLSCALAGLAVAQQATTQPGRSALGAQPALNASVGPTVDHYLANCWNNKINGEVELSQIAQNRAQDPKVRQFATSMVEEHRELSRKLQQLTTGQNAGTPNPAVNKLVAIDNQIAQQVTDRFKQKLEEKSGAQFDQCYMGGQVACHMEAAAALGVVSQQASGQLKRLASETQEKVELQLKKAEQIAQQLMERHSSAQTRTEFDRNVRQARAER
jgi:predicted outer membrane protein